MKDKSFIRSKGAWLVALIFEHFLLLFWLVKNIVHNIVILLSKHESELSQVII